MKTEVTQVAQTAVLIRAAQPEPETIYLQPEAQDIYIGGSDVTVGTGIKLTRSVITPLYIRGGQTLYAITNTGTHPIVCLCESP